ncbi:hypothetical protein QOZ80_6AG0507320 [Eleusine coracana subsp. coracana]|nr:hypothetical protein QOZ80_6AG0507320 [Eleusine coracana subsp. coracana]
MDEEDRTPSSTDEASSNAVLPGNDSEPKFTIKLTIPGYTVVMDDGSRKSFESSNHVLEVIPNGYLMVNLVAAVAARRKWGTCQEATFWIWNVEKKGMVCVTTDAELKSIFEQNSSSKVACFVVEFAMKPTYKLNVALDHKLEKFPIRRNPNVSQESASLGESNDESVEEDNMEPALMVDEDIFLEDDEVFVSLGLRAEEVAARKNMDQDGLGLNDDEPVHDFADDEPRFTIDTENPKIGKGETFPTMVDFRMALKPFAIQNEFEVHKVRTDKKRYRAECKVNGCPWRIVANNFVGQPTVEITMIPHEHECVGTEKLVSSMASHKWVAERVVSWLRKKPELGAGALQDRLLEKYSVEVHYNTVWLGRHKAMEAIYGSWEESFENLFNFRAELIQRSPGTVLEIATIEVEAGIRFDKLFLYLRPCMDGFLNACRPYLGIDSTAIKMESTKGNWQLLQL